MPKESRSAVGALEIRSSPWPRPLAAGREIAVAGDQIARFEASRRRSVDRLLHRTSTLPVSPPPMTAISTRPGNPDGGRSSAGKSPRCVLAQLDEADGVGLQHRCWPRSSITTARPDHKSCARLSQTTCCTMSITLLLRCWSRAVSPAASSPSGITGRNPDAICPVHYIKLIDFTFGAG